MNIDLSEANYKEILAGLVGVIILVVANALLSKRKKLIVKGIRVEGVVYALERERNSSDNVQEYYSPIIRFVTVEKEWVTEKYTFAVSSNSSVIGSSYKEGDKVIVIYDPNYITNFIIDDFNAKIIGPFFIVLGALMVIGAIIHFVYYSGFHF
jgi:hypothetical protein